ncbi:hypothetical protein RLEG12_01045 (plasmid) [Rhizobium leguminosarum bv. trifolii CB782]|nr:hypothetical protein RLEG12_01045 [Rhizobium leguminosarum bv. trifolii CB782]
MFRHSCNFSNKGGAGSHPFISAMETGEVHGDWAISMYVNLDLVVWPIVKAVAIADQFMGRQVHKEAPSN